MSAYTEVKLRCAVICYMAVFFPDRAFVGLRRVNSHIFSFAKYGRIFTVMCTIFER